MIVFHCVYGITFGKCANLLLKKILSPANVSHDGQFIVNSINVAIYLCYCFRVMTKSKATGALTEEPLMSLELRTSFTAFLYRYDSDFAAWFSSTFIESSNDATHAFRSECWMDIHEGQHFAEFVKDAVEEELSFSECYWPDFRIDEKGPLALYGVCLVPPEEGEESLEECISGLRHCLYIRHDDAKLLHTSKIGTTGSLRVSDFNSRESDPVGRWMSGPLGGDIPPLKPIGACQGETRTKIYVYRKRSVREDECTFGGRFWDAVATIPDLATTILLDEAISTAYNNYCMEDGLFSRIMNAFPQTDYETRTAEYEHLLPAIRLLSAEDQQLCFKFHQIDMADLEEDGFMVVAADLYEELKTEFGSTIATIEGPYSLTELQGIEIMNAALEHSRKRKEFEEEASITFRNRMRNLRKVLPFPRVISDDQE
jgi:hypothetical protein